MRGTLRLAAAAAMLAAPYRAGAETNVKRGRYLATVAACVGCHTARTPGAAPLAGGVRFGAGPQAAVSPNITPDRDTGIGTWSTADIVAALHDGRRPDGTRIGPPMPQHAYAGLSERDTAAIASFLKSVPPVRNAVDGRPRDPAPAVAAARAPRDRPAVPRGRYLYEAVAHCGECHARVDGGGAAAKRFPGPHGPVVAPPLTPATLGGLSGAQLEQLIVTGRRPDGSALAGPMPVAAYAGLAADDLAALVDFLKGRTP